MNPGSLCGLPLALAALALLGGCFEKRVLIASDPPGATVWVNDVELGRTPVEAELTFYGTYDVLLKKDGYEPLRAPGMSRAPVYAIPPLDLVATAIPALIVDVTRWEFRLQPSLETALPREQLETELMERARDMRTLTGGR